MSFRVKADRSAALWRLDWGATLDGQGGAHFRVWAPHAREVEVEIDDHRRADLEPQGDGSFQAKVPNVAPGTDYVYILDGQKRRADPTSRHQPRGVHGPSRVVDPDAFTWTDSDWEGLELEELLIYELHVGTFTRAGTFDGVIDRLHYLRNLGVTAVEVMPIAEFPGHRNWGYDGVYAYAPQSSYGGPDGFKRLVDACHRAGLACVLDVVYNHVGPEGNYLRDFGPYFSDRYHTPWGEALNFDGPDSDEVRRFFVENALFWLTEYHVDALRLDAIHAIFDFSAKHVLSELAERYQTLSRQLGRRSWLIAESDLNDACVIRPRSQFGWGLDAQWSDDFHHALFSLLSGAHYGYFVDFGRSADLAKALAQGFVYDGRYSRFRRRRHGNSSADRPGRQFVVFSQNHDQVANASHGRRHGALLSADQQKVALTVLICAPNLPLLFQGQEYGEIAPFHYFTSHSDQALIDAVRRGRKAEFIGFGCSELYEDPQSEDTFEASKLDWSRLSLPAHEQLLTYCRDLIALRKRLGSLRNCRKDLVRTSTSEHPPWLMLERRDEDGSAAMVLVNFHDAPQSFSMPDNAAWRLELSTLLGTRQTLPLPSRTLGKDAGVLLPPWSAAIYSRTHATACEPPTD